MKRLIIAALTVLAVSMVFSACEQDSGNNNNNTSAAGQGGTAGTESLGNNSGPGTR